MLFGRQQNREAVMTGLRRLIRTTLVGGILFLIPLVFVVVIVGKAFQIMKAVATPLAKLISVESFAGYAVVELLTAIIMILCCVLAGTLARSPWARKIHEKLDAVLLQMIPGYAWVKGITGGIRDDDAENLLRPVLVRFDDQTQLAFEVDRAVGGLVAVYVPGAPDPRSGAVSYVTGDRIEPVNAEFKAVVKICRNLGRGSTEILTGQSVG
jgi:uncharacterized membrane protein